MVVFDKIKVSDDALSHIQEEMGFPVRVVDIERLVFSGDEIAEDGDGYQYNPEYIYVRNGRFTFLLTRFHSLIDCIVSNHV